MGRARGGRLTVATETQALAQEFARRPYDAALWLRMARHTAEYGDVRRAAGIYASILRASPTHYPSAYELGLCLERMGQWAQAKSAFAHAASVSEGREGHGIALASLGSVYYRLGYPHNGAKHCDRALAFRDPRPYATWGRSLIRLARGDWAQGWADYEARWQVPQLADAVRRHGIDPDTLPPRWDGGPTDGPVLVYAEQGTGDCLWALRYLAHVEAQSGHPVALQLPPSIAAFHAPGTDRQPVASVPVMSLPHVLQMPAPIGPANTTASHTTRGTGRIGYCWHGESAHGNDRDRSAPYSFAPALTDAGFTPVSLQHGEPTAFADYAETAALMATCDAVLTVDTSVAHLAGTLGVPTVVIPPTVPDWRWPGTGGTTPWYPTVTVVRRADVWGWSDALDRAIRHLGTLAA